MEDKIRNTMADILEIDGSSIGSDFAPDDTDSWDSLNNLRMITALEEEFDVRLSMEDIHKMLNFQAIHDVIKSHVG